MKSEMESAKRSNHERESIKSQALNCIDRHSSSWMRHGPFTFQWGNNGEEMNLGFEQSMILRNGKTWWNEKARNEKLTSCKSKNK